MGGVVRRLAVRFILINMLRGGPRWTMTTIPETPIRGKAPERYYACVAGLPGRPSQDMLKTCIRGRPPITPNRSNSHGFHTLIALILGLNSIGRAYSLRRGRRARWPAHPGGGLAPCAAPPR